MPTFTGNRRDNQSSGAPSTPSTPTESVIMDKMRRSNRFLASASAMVVLPLIRRLAHAHHRMKALASSSGRCRIRSPKLSRQAGTVAALALMVTLATSHPAVACRWYDPSCWADEAFDFVWDELKGVTDLTWDVITLDQKDAWKDFKDIANNKVCAGLTPLSIAISNGVEADFHECARRLHPIEPDILAKLSLYIKSPLDSVRIHEDCNLQGDVVPGSRAAITFGEHIYFATGKYRPHEDEGFAFLAHELLHVLQYRKKGFADFTCEWGLKCRGGIDCAIEQDAYRFQALVFEDRSPKRDKDGVFTCPLNHQQWHVGNVDSHDCNTNTKFMACNSAATGRTPLYCEHLDNCPTRFNPGQEDRHHVARTVGDRWRSSYSNVVGEMTGDACDDGWTSDPDKPMKVESYGDFNGDFKTDIVVRNAGGDLGILTYDGASSFTPLMVAPNNTPFGGWAYDAAADHIVAIADFDGDRRSDILITGPQGIGILSYRGSPHQPR